MKLTETQKLIVESSAAKLLVSAGAGTGKTRVLVERFLHLVSTHQALVTEILALTFTEKAATEMKSRLFASLQQLNLSQARREMESSYISTIHAFAARLLKEHPIEAGLDPDFAVLEAEESEFLKEQALDEAIEKGCGQKDGTFELLKIYGENNIRLGLLKVFASARTEGKLLAEFFSEFKPHLFDEGQNVVRSLEALEEKELALQANKFLAAVDWDWARIGDFRQWAQHFSKRGGKKDKAAWKEIAALCQDIAADRIERLAAGQRESFQALALAFEAVYERKKREESLLDFDDLQMRALWLLQSPRPANQKLLESLRQQFKFVMIDEFQDTNFIQNRLLESLASDSNLFLVGDYKQSIYGFRGTSPEHFHRLEKKYVEGKEGLRISLVENFRTTEPVLGFVNRFFQNLWEEDGFYFEPLVAKAEPPPAATAGPEKSVECLIAPLEEKESMDHARMREAARIAKRMLDLYQDGVPYGDIAVLFQAMTSSGIYEQALKRAGIPYFVIAGRGFYHQPEIRDMISFLSCVESPLSDVPLAATLRSPFFQVTDDALFWLSRKAKSADEMTPLYDGLLQFEEIREIPETEKEKLRAFQSLLGELIADRDRLRVAELLDKILDKTFYELTAFADPQGIRRFANLKKLLALAREYESRQIMTLGDFIRTIRNLENREIRESEAQVEAEGSNQVVRMMTIHAAKGLEFPVVFLADLVHQSQRPESKLFVSEPGIGYSFRIQNERTLDFEEPLTWKHIDEKIQTRETEEWKRLFYVAATRAKRRLILTGVFKEKKIPKENFRDMSSWMDWINAARPGLSDCVEFQESHGFDPLWGSSKEKTIPEMLNGFEPLPAETLFENKADLEREAGASARILSRLAPFEKPVSRAIDLPVSAYACFEKDPDEFWKIYEIGFPDLEKEKEESFSAEGDEAGAALSAAQFGTAVHGVLERLDFSRPDLEQAMNGIFEPQSDSAAAAREILSRFIASPFFAELRRAGKIYRELPFVLNERHGILYGAIDLLYQDDQKRWHLVDYKTAVGNAGKVADSGYELQIGIYSLAVHQILGAVPASARLYFLKNQWEHRLPVDVDRLNAIAGRVREIQEAMLNFRRRVKNVV